MLQCPIKPHVVSYCFIPFTVFLTLLKLKFGDYGTLDALAEQRRVQGGNFDSQVLTDSSLSKTKIR